MEILWTQCSFCAIKYVFEVVSPKRHVRHQNRQNTDTRAKIRCFSKILARVFGLFGLFSSSTPIRCPQLQ